MNRFDYVKYDELSQTQQEYFKHECLVLEKAIDQHKPGRAKALALTALEEFYMWVGKMIRDEQFERTGEVPLQEKRTDS